MSSCRRATQENENPVLRCNPPTGAGFSTAPYRVQTSRIAIGRRRRPCPVSKSPPVSARCARCTAKAARAAGRRRQGVGDRAAANHVRSNRIAARDSSYALPPPVHDSPTRCRRQGGDLEANDAAHKGIVRAPGAGRRRRTRRRTVRVIGHPRRRRSRIPGAARFAGRSVIPPPREETV